jgi:hypothetical protein
MDEEYVLAKIKQLLPEPNVVPKGVVYANLKTEIQKDLSKILNSLYKSQKVTCRKTLNDILITINEQNEKEN